MEYRCVASSADGFVSQVVRYVAGGHVFYFTGRVPEGRDPRALDQKLMDVYGVGLPAWTRSRRRRRGWASVHYLRHGGQFILLSTPGVGPFFEQLGTSGGPGGRDPGVRQFRDIRRESLEFDVYAIRFTACRGDAAGRARRVLVRLNRKTYTSLKRQFIREAPRHSKGELEAMMWALGVYPYRPVLEQLWAVVRAVNRVRRRYGLAELDSRRCIKRRKPAVKVFQNGSVTA